MRFRLLDAFESLFTGHVYKHRTSNQGDLLSFELYEDVYAVDRSPKLRNSVDKLQRGLNAQNTRTGVSARRGDGTFGQLIPGQPHMRIPGYAIARGRVATVDIGIEVKILNKSLLKQVNDRIAGLQKQADYFVEGRDRRKRGNPITIALIGINSAKYTVGHEGERIYRTDGTSKQPHPAQEADAAERRVRDEISPFFDETIILRFRAINDSPYPFEWVDNIRTESEYAASLVRIAGEFERRF